MAIFGSKIEQFVVDEINRRQTEIANPSAMGFVHSARIPYIILESNAVSEGGDSSLARSTVLYGGSDEFIKQNSNGVTKLSRVTLDTYKDYDIGHRPPPGITSIAVNNETPLGSIRRATVNFQCWTLEDLGNLQVLYMNPGIYLYLQWGFTSAASPVYTDSLFNNTNGNSKDKVQLLLRGNTTGSIRETIIRNNGNYDALIGICSTFTWKVNANGGFDCTTTIISPASFVYSFMTDSPDIRSNNFFRWMTGVTDATPATTKDRQSQPTQQVEKRPRIVIAGSTGPIPGQTDARANELAASRASQTLSNDPLATLRLNAEKYTKQPQIEKFFLNEGTEYYQYIALPDEVISEGNILPEDKYYISLGHLFTLINNAFLYGDPSTFMEDLTKNRPRSEFYIANKLVSFMDLANNSAYCKNHIYLRSFNPKDVLIFNSTAEKYVTPADKGLMYRMQNGAVKYRKDLLEFTALPNNIGDVPYKVPEDSSDFRLGHIKRIFININAVIRAMNAKKQFNEFIDEILSIINSSTGGIFNLIKDVDDDLLSIKITDENLTSADALVTTFTSYNISTVIRNIQLDGNLPSQFQTAAYVGNTNVNPNQRDAKTQVAFKAASNGFYDGNANITEEKNPDAGYYPQYADGIQYDDRHSIAKDPAPRGTLLGTTSFLSDKEKGWDVVLGKSLSDTSAINYQNQFNSILKVYTRGSDVSYIGFPVGITLSMELDGLGGFYYGNLFNVDYVPLFLQKNVCFRIINIIHSVAIDGWTTKVSGCLIPFNGARIKKALDNVTAGSAASIANRATTSTIAIGGDKVSLRVDRDIHTSTFTMGKLYINDVYYCDTVEDTVRYNQAKVYGETAIPHGAYNVDINYSGVFGRYLPEIQNVPNFTGIRIHWGATARSTKGCLIVGKDRNITIGRVNDTNAVFEDLFAALNNAFSSGKKISITIREL